MVFIPPRGSAAYRQEVYLNKDRWVSYAWQVRLITDLLPQGRILEIGLGNGIVENFLKSRYDTESVDVDESLHPTYVGSVARMDFLPVNSFDLVLCAEVLEHLPFDQFAVSLRELQRVTRSYVILSLPYWGYTFGLKIRLPVFGTRVLKFKINGFQKHVYRGQHHWEVGKRGFPLRKIKDQILAANFQILLGFWDLDDAYHYYFVLKKLK